MKTVALAVLAGFLATVAPGSGAAPLDCCGTKCPACAAASGALAAAAPGFGAADLVRLARLVARTPGFQRPMRN